MHPCWIISLTHFLWIPTHPCILRSLTFSHSTWIKVLRPINPNIVAMTPLAEWLISAFPAVSCHVCFQGDKRVCQRQPTHPPNQHDTADLQDGGVGALTRTLDAHRHIRTYAHAHTHTDRHMVTQKHGHTHTHTHTHSHTLRVFSMIRN